jgi:hypothetical protein
LIVHPASLKRSRNLAPSSSMSSIGARSPQASLLQFIFSDRFSLRQDCCGPNVPPRPQYRWGLPRGLRRGLVALGAGCLLIGGASFAADDVSIGPPVIPAVRVDQETEALLHTIEQQISGEHIVLPRGDNAMETWQRVLQRVLETKASPGVLQALTDFEGHARLRAVDEEAAGRLLVAVELTVFANQADQLMRHIPPSVSFSATAAAKDAVTHGAPRVTSDGVDGPTAGVAARAPPSTLVPATDAATPDASPVASAGTAGSAAGLAARGTSAIESFDTPDPATDMAAGGAPPVASASTAASVADVAARGASPVDSARAKGLTADGVNRDAAPIDSSGTSAASSLGTTRDAPAAGGRTDTAGARIAQETAKPTLALALTAQGQAMAAFYAGRGDEMLGRKDISAARKFYEYAANAGSARAATALAKTYDAAFVTQLGVVGLRPDPEVAALWYRRAAASGDPDAEARLVTLRAEGR